VTKEDIYQNCKQFQHFLLLATLFMLHYHYQTKIFSPPYVLIISTIVRICFKAVI